MSEQRLEMADNSALFLEALASIASFLKLQDILACRLTCVEGLNQVHSSLTVKDCAILLSLVLQTRRVVVTGNTQQWKDAGNDAFDAIQCMKQLDTAATNPLDTLLRIMRVLLHLPSQLAVCYSSKYGRFCAPCHAHSGSMQREAYSKCSRGKQNCSTCAFKIPPRAISSPGENEEGEEEGEFDNIYSVLSITARETKNSRAMYSLDLEHFHCKCVPNIPPDLICPLCRENTRRTLLLTAFSYQSELSAAREQPGHMSLSFTPLLEPMKKRARKHQHTQASERFPPPEYSDMFLPRASGSRLLRYQFRQDCKHAMSIHCTSCQKFGLIAPSRICMPCHLRFDESALHVGAALFRPEAENATRMHCFYCTQRPDTESEESDEESEEDDDGDDENGRDAAVGVSEYRGCSYDGGFHDDPDEENMGEDAFEYGGDEGDDGDYY